MKKKRFFDIFNKNPVKKILTQQVVINTHPVFYDFTPYDTKTSSLHYGN